jgi:hypothetical protein
MKSTQKKEYFKLYGLAAEIFEESLIPFLPKVLSNLQKKVKEGDNHIHSAVAEAFGK